VTAHQNGMRNTVCVMGTAFREDHLILLAGYTNNIVLIFDNDAGGRGALGSFNEKHIEEKRERAVNIYRCSLQDYKGGKFKDDDDFIREQGIDQFRQFVDKSIKDSFTQKRLKDIKKVKKVAK
jgi:DNA primase